MSKQTKDLVAAAHQAFVMDEISLKQLAILFNRITIQGLSRGVSPALPQAVQRRNNVPHD
ncbi:MAG TPA: hypothetical protein VIK24_06625 [Pyrinomonadaceae bacterium]